MEAILVHFKKVTIMKKNECVLILVVVEAILVPLALRQVSMGAAGLNPCCSGSYSSTKYRIERNKKPCLNPCCSGSYSSTNASEKYAVKLMLS